MRMKNPIFLLTLFCAAAPGATLFLGAYPDSVIVFDEDKGQVVDKIPLTTGLPISMRLSMDRKKIYVTTNDHSGIEVIDGHAQRFESRKFFGQGGRVIDLFATAQAVFGTGGDFPMTERDDLSRAVVQGARA